MVSYDHPVTWKKLLFQQKKSQISEYGWFFKCTMSLLKMEYKGAHWSDSYLFIHKMGLANNILSLLINTGNLSVQKKRKLLGWFCW